MSYALPLGIGARYPDRMNAPFRIVATPERARLRVEDFLLLAGSGAFDDYTKTELVDGDIYVMNAQFSRHARTQSRLLVELTLALRAIDSDLEAWVEVAVRATDHDMPEPDIVLTRWRGGGAVPVGTVAMVVEVADSTLVADLGRKAELYAAAGISEYWVVDVEGRRVLIHHRPEPAGYACRAEVALGDRLASATIEGLEVGTADLVG